MRRIALAAVAFTAALLAPTSPSVASGVFHPPPHISHRGNGTASSTNWSGYAAYNATFTDVKASWVQPAVTCPSATAQYASFWVGIDGYKSSSVEQLGTDSDCTGTNRPSYYAWWEMYPNPSNTIAGFAVHPGDHMSAEVSVLATVYTLKLVNSTTGQTFSTTKVASAANSSAEWVAEAPSQCIIIYCRVLPLSNFGTVNFTGSYTTSGGVSRSISGYTNDSITMTNMIGTVRAVPSGLSPDGTSFSDTWRHS